MVDRRLIASFFRPSALARRAADLARVLSAHAAGTRHPLFVQFLATARCTQSCTYCEVPPVRFPEMDGPAVLAMLDELCREGMRKVSFTGGEPLLRRELPEWIRTVRSRGVYANLITNGHLLADRIDEVRDLDLVIVSVDGREASHDAVRGAGSHARALRGLAACAERGVPVMTSTVLHRGTAADIDWVLDLARSLHGTAIFGPIEFAPGCVPAAAAGLVLRQDELRAAYATLLDRKRAGAPVGYTRHFLARAVRGEPAGPCRFAGRLYCSILPDGRVLPCNVLLSLAAGDAAWVNGRESGFVEAMRRMPAFSCAGCAAGYGEMDAMLRFRWWEMA
ncbi:MAG: radical SAM protein [Deltaproteobacteria bacterium]|nr:radical SAM protein [Deltaproteobacteria bacterium]